MQVEGAHVYIGILLYWGLWKMEQDHSIEQGIPATWYLQAVMTVFLEGMDLMRIACE